MARALTALALSNDATSDRHGEFTGDPTEVALFRAWVSAQSAAHWKEFAVAWAQAES